MNNVRRKEIKRIISRFDDLSGLIEELKENISSVMDEEQESFDNLPEGLQCSERGEKMESAIESLQSAIDSLEEIDLEEITSYLEESAE